MTSAASTTTNPLLGTQQPQLKLGGGLGAGLGGTGGLGGAGGLGGGGLGGGGLGAGGLVGGLGTGGLAGGLGTGGLGGGLSTGLGGGLGAGGLGLGAQKGLGTGLGLTATGTQKGDVIFTYYIICHHVTVCRHHWAGYIQSADSSQPGSSSAAAATQRSHADYGQCSQVPKTV